MDINGIVQRIKQLSKESGLSVTQALMQSGVGKDFVYNMTREKKPTKPSAEKISLLSQYFNVSENYLLHGKDDTIRVYDEDDNIVVLDDETRDLIDSLRKRPEMKILFSVSKKATKEDIIQAVKIIEALKDDKEGS